MNPNRILFTALLGLASLASGTVIGLVLGGFGICAIDLTSGLLICSALIGATLSATMAMLWRKAWWVGALGFSLPTLLGLSLGLASKDWQRVSGICACIAASVVAALVVRYPGPTSLKR